MPRDCTSIIFCIIIQYTTERRPIGLTGHLLLFWRYIYSIGMVGLGYLVMKKKRYANLYNTSVSKYGECKKLAGDGVVCINWQSKIDSSRFSSSTT